jgi:hypothetical protein
LSANVAVAFVLSHNEHTRDACYVVVCGTKLMLVSFCECNSRGEDGRKWKTLEENTSEQRQEGLLNWRLCWRFVHCGMEGVGNLDCLSCSG